MSASISLVIVARDCEAYVRAAVGSVLRQTRGDFELLVWDDGSADRTADLAEAMGGGDARVRVVRAERCGATASLRAAAQKLSGRYLGWLDGRDALAPTALERTASVLDDCVDVGLVYTKSLTMDERGAVGGSGSPEIPYSKDALLVDFITTQFRLMRRTAYDVAGGLDDAVELAHDYDLCLRLSEVTNVRALQEPLHFRRVRSGDPSPNDVQVIEASAEAIRRALRRRGMADDFEVEVEIVGRFELQPKRPGEKLAAAAYHPEFALMAPGDTHVAPDRGLVSCLCVTGGRAADLRRTLQCLGSQTVRQRELVVVYEELEEPARALLAESAETIVLVRVRATPKLPLGVLRNLSLAAARGEYVCSWDDDDWYAPRRIEQQLDALVRSQSDACVLGRWLMLDEATGRTYVSGKRLWEGSLLCRRNVEGLLGGYPALEHGEDRILVERLRERHRVAVLDRPELYTYTYRGNNARRSEHFLKNLDGASELDQTDGDRLRGIVESAASTHRSGDATRKGR